MKKTLLAFLILSATAQAGYDVATFADTGLISGVNQYNNDSGGFTSGSQSFNNTYTPAYGGYWNGFSASSTTDTTTPGYTNQYSSITGSGNGDAYLCGALPDRLRQPDRHRAVDRPDQHHLRLSLDAERGLVRKAFTTGSFFDVVITGYSGMNDTGMQTGSVTYFLANYTSPTSTPVNTWNTVSSRPWGRPSRSGSASNPPRPANSASTLQNTSRSTTWSPSCPAFPSRRAGCFA